MKLKQMHGRFNMQTILLVMLLVVDGGGVAAAAGLCFVFVLE